MVQAEARGVVSRFGLFASTNRILEEGGGGYLSICAHIYILFAGTRLGVRIGFTDYGKVSTAAKIREGQTGRF